MELDEVKKIWQENEALKAKQILNENKIREMLRNKGKSALSKLIRNAKIYAIIIIPLGLLVCLNSYKFFQAGGYYVIWPLLFLFICICLEPLEMYLYRLLKSIDYSTMSVKEVSEKILKYQNIIRKSQLYGTVVFVIYLVVWYFLYYKLIFGDQLKWEFIIYMAFLLIVGLFALPLLYRRLYYKNINKIKRNLQELELFEQEETIK